MAKLHNLARVNTSTTGLHNVVIGAPVAGFLSFGQVGVRDGELLTYAIVDGDDKEIGRGTYTVADTTLTRSVIQSTNNNGLINLSGNAQVYILEMGGGGTGGTSGESQPPEEGPGIDLIGARVGLGGDTILLYKSNGDPVAEYAPTDTGLTAAGAAVISASDRIEIPGNAVIQAEHALAGCEYRFPAGLIVGGTLTLSANTRVWNLQSIVSGNSEDAIIGVLGPGDGEAHLFSCRIAPVNSGAGGVHAVHVGSSGNLVCHNCYLDGTSGGYAGYRDPECAGTLRIEGGAALGSSADDPFNE